MNFTELDHKYFTDSGRVYTSVTTLLGKLKPYEDWEAILQKTAKKRKIDPEVLRAEWTREKDLSCEKGTAFHNKREQELINNGCVIYGDEKLTVFQPIWEGETKKATSLKLEPGVYPELLMWLDSIELAGQADYVEVTNQNILNIKDWKTNKKIEFKGFTNWKGETKKLNYPIGHLDNCNGSIYSLQLNMYAYIILRHNPKLKLGTMTLVHITTDEEGNTIEIPYEVPNLQREIKVIIDLVKQGKL